MSDTAITAFGYESSIRTPWPTSTARATRHPRPTQRSVADTSPRQYLFDIPGQALTSSDTGDRELPEKLDKRLEALFNQAREEFFEEGVASIFSKELVDVVVRYGDTAIIALAPYIANRKLGAEVAAETIRWLSQIESGASYDSRRWLIEHSLQSEVARVRDSAALSLASLDDPHAIPYLKQAAQGEYCEELRENIQAIITYLERLR